jgi:3-oxoacyl-[acyl-carrier-protein] synthase II
MAAEAKIVITGVGVVSPIGIGNEPFWASLRDGRSGVKPYSLLEGTEMPVRFGGEITDFEPKQHVKPRKSLKVMCREIQLGFAAAALAIEDAEVVSDSIHSDRFGVVYGSEMLFGPVQELEDTFHHCRPDGKMDGSLYGERFMTNIYPLWLLRYLPNMAACHIGIAHGARGPNNSITLGEASGLLAINEAMRIMQRGGADIMIVGGVGSRLDLTQMLFRGDANLSHRDHDPAGASRPFDADRDGIVNGEGAAAFILETETHAEQRSATVLARLRGCGNSFESRLDRKPATGVAIRTSISQALAEAGISPTDVGHVNAHGVSTIQDDRLEAQAIRDCLADVPITAPKSFFGNLGAGTASVEMAASVLGLVREEVPFTLNYETPDPDCPVNVVHDEPLSGTKPTALLLSQSGTGQAAALVISRD